MPGVYFAKFSEEQAIARLRKIHSWTGEKAAIKGSDDGHQNDDRNYRASRMSHDALGYTRPDVFAGRDLRNGKHAHIGNIRQHVNCRASRRSNGERPQNIASWISNLPRHKTELHPSVAGQYAGDQRHAEVV